MNALYNWLFPAPKPDEEWELVESRHLSRSDFDDLMVRVSQIEKRTIATQQDIKSLQIEIGDIFRGLKIWGNEAEPGIERVWVVFKRCSQFNIRDEVHSVEGGIVAWKSGKLEPFVADFEAIVYGTLALHDNSDGRFFSASYSSTPFQMTNGGSHSLSLAIERRLYAHKLLTELEGLPQLIHRMKTLIHWMVEYEKIIPETAYAPTFFFGGHKIMRGVNLLQEELRYPPINYQNYLRKKVLPENLSEFFKKRQ